MAENMQERMSVFFSGMWSFMTLSSVVHIQSITLGAQKYLQHPRTMA